MSKKEAAAEGRNEDDDVSYHLFLSLICREQRKRSPGKAGKTLK